MFSGSPADITMTASLSPRLTIAVGADHRVSGLFDRPDRARALLVLAHGAGAGMEHPSMQAVAAGLTERGIASLRYQFPYMERGSRRPDPLALCHATVRAAAATAAGLAPDLPLIAAGRSFGGRMTSQAQSLRPLPAVRALVFLAFPLHPAGKPGIDRAAHLRRIDIPMLFIQGTHDALAQRSLLQPLVESLGSRASLHLLHEADHAFHAPARSGRKDADVRAEALDALCRWVDALGIGT
jgi:predicted alpha/beta-hydrolase family hydrolase